MVGTKNLNLHEYKVPLKVSNGRTEKLKTQIQKKASELVYTEAKPSFAPLAIQNKKSDTSKKKSKNRKCRKN